MTLIWHIFHSWHHPPYSECSDCQTRDYLSLFSFWYSEPLSLCTFPHPSCVWPGLLTSFHPKSVPLILLSTSSFSFLRSYTFPKYSFFCFYAIILLWLHTFMLANDLFSSPSSWILSRFLLKSSPPSPLQNAWPQASCSLCFEGI